MARDNGKHPLLSTGRLANHDYVGPMNRSFRVVLLVAVSVVLLGGCASDSDLSSDTALKTGGAVPGEKTGDDAMSATAGPGTAAAGVRW